MTQPLEQRLRSDVIDFLLTDPSQATYGRHDSLLDILDSLQMMRLADRLESLFRLRIHNSELTVENFGTLAKLSTYVDGKVATRGKS